MNSSGGVILMEQGRREVSGDPGGTTRGRVEKTRGLRRGCRVTYGGREKGSKGAGLRSPRQRGPRHTIGWSFGTSCPAPASALGTPGARPPPVVWPRLPGPPGAREYGSPSGSAVGSRPGKKGPQGVVVDRHDLGARTVAQWKEAVLLDPPPSTPGGAAPPPASCTPLNGPGR